MHERSRLLSRLRRAFPDLEPNADGYARYPEFSTRLVSSGVLAQVFININFGSKPDARVRDAIAPFVEGYQRMARSEVHVFICHASEDKPAARDLASALTKRGTPVWFDEWEIRIGDSIVQRIDSALGTVSHLVVLLSQHAITRPWVQREFSSALMRQLSQQSIRVLPIRLDECQMPAILSDIKYADARGGMEHVVAELERAIFSGE